MYTIKKLEVTFQKLDEKIEHEKTKSFKESGILGIAKVYNSIFTSYGMARKIMNENGEPEEK